MAKGITPELDKVLNKHGRNQNMEIDTAVKKATYTTPRGQTATVPLKDKHINEVKARVAEQQENVRDANKRTGNHPDLDSTITGKWGIMGY